MLATRGSLVSAYDVSYALFTQEVQEELLHQATASSQISRSDELSDLIAGCDVLHAVSLLELATFIGERLLRDTDAASMAVSLEVRVPLLDHAVIEAAAAMHPDARFKPLGSKTVLRKICLEHVDPKVFERPKSGFVLPIEKWCREQLKEEVTSTLADAALCARVGLDHRTVNRLWRTFEAQAPGMYWSRIWALFVLLWWCREHDVAL
jgi:asparagine synthase (glutamine-hydrolysing)